MSEPDPATASDAAILPADEPRRNFLPYPASTLSPPISPTDLSSFKSRGASKAQRALRQQLAELHEQYRRVIDEFNWNKLVYESEFNFEPVTGETYHLYRMDAVFRLSLISPGEWPYPFVGSFRLDSDGRWNLRELAEGFDLQAFLAESGAL